MVFQIHYFFYFAEMIDGGGWGEVGRFTHPFMGERKIPRPILSNPIQSSSVQFTNSSIVNQLLISARAETRYEESGDSERERKEQKERETESEKIIKS